MLLDQPRIMPTHRIPTIPLLLVLGAQVFPRAADAAKPEVKVCLMAHEASKSLAKQQKLLEQREQLLRCSAAQCPSDIRTDCVSKVEDVNRAIPSVVFHVTDPAGNDLSAVRVTMDGTLFATQLTGASMPLNPGKHQFRFEVEGQAPVQKEFVILTAQKDRVEDITFAATHPSPALPLEPAHGTEPKGTSTAAIPAVSFADAQVRTNQRPILPRPESNHGLSQKTWAIISGSAGIVAVSIGTALAISAKRTASNAACDANNICSPEGASDRTAAIHRANWSMLPTGIGIAALGTGLVLWFVKQPKAGELHPAAALSLSGERVSVTGRF